MKKLTIGLLSVLLSLTFNPIMLKAGSEITPISTVANPTTESSEYKAMIDRVYEIKSIDKSQLSSSVKKELREELRTIKKKLRNHDGNNGGIYISVGGLLLIILLLIIFL